MALFDDFRREVAVPVSAQSSTRQYNGIPWAGEGPDDRYAPFLGPKVCLSPAGRWRAKHVWVKNLCCMCGRRKG